MTTERDGRFSSWLASHLKEMGVKQREVAKWLGIDVGAVNRRLAGQRPFLREELETIDWILGEDGALLQKAGYIPDDAYPPGVGIWTRNGCGIGLTRKRFFCILPRWMFQKVVLRDFSNIWPQYEKICW
jgi:hypothetical protein